MTKKSDEDSIHPSETAYDKAIKRMEEREAHIFNTPAMQIAADAAEQIRIQQAPLIQALQPLQDALQPYHNLIDQNSLGLVAASLSSVAQTIVPDNAVGSMTESLNVVATAIQPYQQDMNLFNSNVLAAFEAAAITPELRDFRTQFEVNVQEMGDGMSAISDYVNGLTSQWDNALGVANVLERSIAAQNLAMVRMLPCYSDLELPRGSKNDKIRKELSADDIQKIFNNLIVKPIYVIDKIPKNESIRLFDNPDIYEAEDENGRKFRIITTIVGGGNYARVLHGMTNAFELKKLYETGNEHYWYYNFIIAKNEALVEKIMEHMGKTKVRKLFADHSIQTAVCYLNEDQNINIAKANFDI